MSTNKLEKIAGFPDSNYAVARCFGANGRRWSGGAPRAHEGHGVTWRHASGANLQNLKCPVDGGPLFQTTRSWSNYNGWTVIPEDVVKAAAASKRAEKAAKIQKLIDAGTHKYVRDLQPGEVFSNYTRSKTLRSGKVVSVEKVGAKYRVEVSYTREAVVKGYLYFGLWKNADVEARANKLEQLTSTAEVSGTTIVIVDPELFLWQGFAKEDFAGFASDYPEATLAELWNNEVKRWTRVLEDKEYAVKAPVRYRTETDAAFEERRQRAVAQAAADKAQAELSLQVAIDRLVRHTGSAVTSA